MFERRRKGLESSLWETNDGLDLMKGFLHKHPLWVGRFVCGGATCLMVLSSVEAEERRVGGGRVGRGQARSPEGQE